MQMRCQQSLTRTREHVANGLATKCEQDTLTEWKAKPRDKHKQQRPKNCLLAMIARLNFAEYFAYRFTFAPTSMTALNNRYWSRRGKISNHCQLCSLCSQSVRGGKRLTHNQPREKPRHRKDTHSTVDAAQHRHREL